MTSSDAILIIPVGSILHLDIPGPAGTSDDGSIIVSSFSNDHWTVSTIRTPIDGAHPVSGNRKWGYELNSNGGYTFYVTGATRRLTTGRHELLEYILGVPFSRADLLWESYQSKVNALSIQTLGVLQLTT